MHAEKRGVYRRRKKEEERKENDNEMNGVDTDKQQVQRHNVGVDTGRESRKSRAARKQRTERTHVWRVKQANRPRGLTE